MKLTLRLFALAKDLVGQETLSLTVPEPCTVAELRALILEEHPELKEILSRCAIAVDSDFASEDLPLQEGAEIAILPPVSGGS